MSNDENKVYPTHRISFSEKQDDGRGRDKLGAPVEVATVWPRKHGKQGGIIQWNIAPEKLNNGVFFMLENERQHERGNNKQGNGQDGFAQTEARNTGQDVGRTR